MLAESRVRARGDLQPRRVILALKFFHWTRGVNILNEEEDGGQRSRALTSRARSHVSARARWVCGSFGLACGYTQACIFT